MRITTWSSLLLGIITGPVWAAPGELDTTFDTDGIAHYETTAHNAGGTVIALQSDGKIIMASRRVDRGGMYVMRVNPNGSIDDTFGTNGYLITGSGGWSIKRLIVQADDSILVGVGTQTQDYSVVRISKDGALDDTFGNNGIVNIDIGAALGTSQRAEYFEDMTLLPDGKLLLTGVSWTGATTNRNANVVRLNPDGSLDTTFGTNGVTNFQHTNLKPFWGYAVTAQDDGKIILLGRAYWGNDVNKSRLIMVRYNADGRTVDPVFGAASEVNHDLDGTPHDHEGYTHGEAMLLLPDGKILVGGRVGLNSATNILLARYTRDGDLDPTFSDDGYTVVDRASGNGDRVYVMQRQPDGKILIATQVGIMRFTEDGDVDQSFGVNGAATSNFLQGTHSVFEANDFALQADGKIVVAGSASEQVNSVWTANGIITRWDNNAFDTEPDAFQFTDRSGATANMVETSNLVTIAGLGAGLAVPVSVQGGEYALDGGTSYATFAGFASNGTQINVRHTAAANEGESVDTLLTVGGISNGFNQQRLLGATASDTFTSTVGGADADADGVADDEDNAPGNFNPDQSDIDGDGAGDVADPCPADASDMCNQDRSAADSLGGAGGVVETPDGAASIDIPAGGLAADTSISITDTGGNFVLGTDLGQADVVFEVNIGPDGTTFLAPVTVTMVWVDADNDGVVDGTAIGEPDLRIFKDATAITDVCANEPTCDQSANTFSVEVTSLSDFALGAVQVAPPPPPPPPPPAPKPKKKGGGSFGLLTLLMLLVPGVVRRRREAAHRRLV